LCRLNVTQQEEEQADRFCGIRMKTNENSICISNLPALLIQKFVNQERDDPIGLADHVSALRIMRG